MDIELPFDFKEFLKLLNENLPDLAGFLISMRPDRRRGGGIFTNVWRSIAVVHAWGRALRLRDR